MRSVVAVARRELQIMLRAPIVYIVGGLFLVVQGIAFAGLVGAMSDPRDPAPLGDLLEGQLAGTLLTWVLALVVLTLLGMRAIADERRAGGWELLLTAPVGEGAAVVGKWLAASIVYALLWLPTLAYFVVVAMFRGDHGGWDAGAIAAGYAGAIAIGAALLAWAIAASAATSTTLAAGAAGFALLVAWFLVGELPSVWPDLAHEHPGVAAALAAASVRETATGFARGDIALAAVVRVAGLAATGLSLAIALACAGRRRRGEVRRRALATVLVGAIAVLGSIAADRHPVRWDVSASGRSTLDAGTREVLAAVPGRAKITIVQPTLGALAPVYDEVARVVDRMAEVGPIDVARVDPITDRDALEALARAGGLGAGDLASNGAVVVEVGGRREVVDRAALATYDVSGRVPTLAALSIERAVAGALARRSSPAPATVCMSTGHGELQGGKTPSGADWSAIVERVKAEGMTVDEREIGENRRQATGDRQPATEAEKSTGLDGCDVLIVAAPIRPVTADEALAVQRFVARGGGLLVAAPAAIRPGGTLGETGLEGVLAEVGLGLPAAIAIDPQLAVPEIPGALLVMNGYTDHPINRGFARTRATLWFPPRVVVAEHGATPLVVASRASWGERDLTSAAATKDDDDLAGPSVLAAAGNAHRVVAIGSADSFVTGNLASGASAGDLWVAHVIRWLANRPEPTIDAPSHTPAQMRLVMSPGDRNAVIGLCVAGIPLAWTLAGALLVYLRRRRNTP